jgi:DNA-binding LacI/PurR family transcriptional regulator
VFREAASAAGLEPAEHFIPVKVDMPGESNRTVSEFRKRFSGNLELPQDATAAICYNDTMATALCIALNERGLRVPDDVSVVGFDDTQAIYAAPPLTTISHSFAQMGCAAVSYLNDWIESDAERTEEIIRVPSRLVVRESTAAPTEL